MMKACQKVPRVLKKGQRSRGRLNGVDSDHLLTYHADSRAWISPESAHSEPPPQFRACLLFRPKIISLAWRSWIAVAGQLEVQPGLFRSQLASFREVGMRRRFRGIFLGLPCRR